jgi:hypothetical protein
MLQFPFPHHIEDRDQGHAKFGVGIFHQLHLAATYWSALRVRTHLSHQMTVAAMALVAINVLILRSKRVASLRQSLKRQNMRSMTNALLVDGVVAVELDLAVPLGRDDGGGAARGEPGAQVVAVIAPFG